MTDRKHPTILPLSRARARVDKWRRQARWHGEICLVESDPKVDGASLERAARGRSYFCAGRSAFSIPAISGPIASHASNRCFAPVVTLSTPR